MYDLFRAHSQQVRQKQSLLIEKQRNEYEQKIMQWQTQAQAAIHEKSLMETQYQQLHQTHATLTETHNALVLEHSPIKNAYENLEQENEKLHQKHQEQMQQLEVKQHTIIELKVILKTENTKIISLEDSLNKAHDKIDSQGIFSGRSNEFCCFQNQENCKKRIKKRKPKK